MISTECPHDDWVILGHNQTRPALCGTCTKCGLEVVLSELLNNWKARVEREIKRALESK